MNELDFDLEKAETQASDLQQGRRLPLDEDSSDTESLDQDIARHPTHISRLEDQDLQHLHTVGSTATSQPTHASLPKFGGGKPYPPQIHEARSAYVVDFDGPNDPLVDFSPLLMAMRLFLIFMTASFQLEVARQSHYCGDHRICNFLLDLCFLCVFDKYESRRSRISRWH